MWKKLLIIGGSSLFTGTKNVEKYVENVESVK